MGWNPGLGRGVSQLVVVSATELWARLLSVGLDVVLVMGHFDLLWIDTSRCHLLLHNVRSDDVLLIPNNLGVAGILIFFCFVFLVLLLIDMAVPPELLVLLGLGVILVVIWNGLWLVWVRLVGLFSLVLHVLVILLIKLVILIVLIELVVLGLVGIGVLYDLLVSLSLGILLLVVHRLHFIVETAVLGELHTLLGHVLEDLDDGNSQEIEGLVESFRGRYAWDYWSLESDIRFYGGRVLELRWVKLRGSVLVLYTLLFVLGNQLSLNV